ncbi:hypothetical protein Tco_0577806 [Tanacetum coccineum]
MENVNPFGPHVPQNAPRDQTVQELDELLEILAMIDSRLENIDHNQIKIPPLASPKQPLNDFMNPPDFLEMNDLEFDVQFEDTPFVSLFLDSDDESNDGEVINDIYVNTGLLHFDPILSMNIITRKTFNTIMVKELASRDNNFVAIVRNVHVFVGSFTYVTDFTVLEDIGEYIKSELSEVVMGKYFKGLTQLEDNRSEGLISFNSVWDTYICHMPLMVPRFKNYHAYNGVKSHLF